MTLYAAVWYFMIYSFLGWVLEVVYHAVGQGLVVNRGFLNGPVCPIYGVGVILIFTLAELLITVLIADPSLGICQLILSALILCQNCSSFNLTHIPNSITSLLSDIQYTFSFQSQFG